MANDATLHIRLEKQLKQELENYGEAYDIKLSNVIRIALEEFADRNYDSAPTTKIVKTKINAAAF